MATTKRGGGDSDKGRPRIHSSHSLRDGGPSPRPKRPKPAGGAKSAKPAGQAPKRPEAKRPAAPSALGPRTRKARPQPAPSVGTGPSIASDESRAIALAIAIAGIEKKAVGLEILDVAGKVDYADFLVLMTGRSDRQVAALAQGIEEALRKKNKRPLSVEGQTHATWILMDYGDVVVHVFQDDARSLYDIDGLWLDARRIPIPIPEGARAPAEDPLRD